MTVSSNITTYTETNNEIYSRYRRRRIYRSKFCALFAKKYADYQVINLDKLTYAGNLDNLSDCADCANYKFVQGDICDRDLVEKLFRENDIRGVVHFAAESHVDNSITGPKAFIETNVLGTFTLLDVARNYWMSAPHQFREGYEDSRFHHISTDEVYGALGETGVFFMKRPRMIRVRLIRRQRPVRI